MEILITIGIIALILFIVIVVLLNLYVVVEPNKAHVVVFMGKGRKVYHPGRDKDSKSSYFYIPFLMRRIIVSLENVKHEINEIKLRDIKFAPFKSDITCWFRIENSDLAAQTLDVDTEGSITESIRETLNAQVQGIVRAAAMKQEIIELMQDRKTFGASVFAEVNGSLNEWGVQLVKLEIIDFSDAGNSTIIADYEKRREAEISSKTRQDVAERDKEARLKEAAMAREAETAEITAKQAIEMRDLERKEITGVRDQNAQLEIEKQKALANAQQVEAEKTKVVGQAQYNAEATVVKAEGDANAAVKTATGDKDAQIERAKGESQEIDLKGTAEATIITKKGTAEATAIEKKAEAQKKFQEASKEIEMAKIAADVQKTQYESMAAAMQNADINIVSPDMKFMGLGAKEGAGLGAMLETLQETSGVDLKAIVGALAKKKETPKEETSEEGPIV